MATDPSASETDTVETLLPLPLPLAAPAPGYVTVWPIGERRPWVAILVAALAGGAGRRGMARRSRTPARVEAA